MAYLMFANEILDRGVQTLCPSVTVLLLSVIYEHIVLSGKYQKTIFSKLYRSVAETTWNQMFTCSIEIFH